MPTPVSATAITAASVRTALRTNDDLSTVRRVGECVPEQVGEHLEHPVAVDVDRKRRAVADLERDALVVELGSKTRTLPHERARRGLLP